MGVVWVLVIAVGVVIVGVGIWWGQRDETRRAQREAAVTLGVGAVIAAIGVMGIA